MYLSPGWIETIVFVAGGWAILMQVRPGIGPTVITVVSMIVMNIVAIWRGRNE